MSFDHLGASTEQDVRNALLAGLGSLRARTKRTSFGYSEVVHQVATALLQGPLANSAASAWEGSQMAYFPHPHGGTEYPDNEKLLAAIWGLIGEGILFPRLKTYDRDGHPHVIDRLVLTERGERLTADGDPHPLHPGFIKRFRARAPNVSDEVVARVEDAVSCLERSLLRAAVVMTGLAAEETLRVTHAMMVKTAHIKKKAASSLAKSRDVLDEVANAAQSWTTANDERHRLKIAIQTLESIRTDRNQVSHPGIFAPDAAAVEELVVLAARQLPVFWEIPIQHALNNGFHIP
ncbi:MAG TPA: hypothetical protein VH062_20375 [Polyangiaceae bacterium]|jgi:hypothetical protein|nr:hypothetical protein [Polyangiaceae bacterium]